MATRPLLAEDIDAAVCQDCGGKLPKEATFVGKYRWAWRHWTCGHSSWTCPTCLQGNHHTQCPECGRKEEYT